MDHAVIDTILASDYAVTYANKSFHGTLQSLHVFLVP